MLFVRPGELSDMDQLERMACADGPILHSLPSDRQRLQELVGRSNLSLQAEVRYPAQENYLFVLEDSDTGELLGSASISARAGHDEPFHAFREQVSVHASRTLNVNHEVRALMLSHDLTSHSRLTGFYLDSGACDQPRLAASLLSSARIGFAAQSRERFADDLFTLLPGVTDQSGRVPFWDGVGSKFFNRNFREMEFESRGRSRTFIAEMMPTDPLYVALLSPEAQQSLGRPHAGFRELYELHLAEGMKPSRFVDIFDGGPVMVASFDSCYSVRHSSLHEVSRGVAMTDGVNYLVSNTRTRQFRCAMARLPEIGCGTVPLPDSIAELLQVTDGDVVRCVPMPGKEAA